MKVVDLNYHTHNHDNLELAFNTFSTSYQYIYEIVDSVLVIPVIQLRKKNNAAISGISCFGFKGYNSFFYIPFTSHNFIKQQNPDIVIIQGLIFPLKVLALKILLGKQTKIILQHHGERPFSNPFKRWLQRLTDTYIAAYMFTSKGNAKVWIDSGIIGDINKCHEVLEASTFLSVQNKAISRQKCNITASKSFLWVGRLNEGKDPLTVLKGFEQFLLNNTDAVLYMVYQDETLLTEVKACISQSSLLKKSVSLVGKVQHETLAFWYSAADYYISGSHHEGSGYALIECMACGCIPVVTDIPPFRTITDNGRLAVLFEAGNPNSLTDALYRLNGINTPERKKEILQYFEEKLSFKSIAEDIYVLCKKVLS